MSRFKHLLTDYDNKTYDTGRCVAVFLVVMIVVFQAWNLVLGRPFDPLAFGGGCATILGSLGIAIAGDNFRRPDAYRFEPEQDELEQVHERRLVRPRRRDLTD